jgi:hypothetical protein
MNNNPTEGSHIVKQKEARPVPLRWLLLFKPS